MARPSAEQEDRAKALRERVKSFVKPVGEMSAGELARAVGSTAQTINQFVRHGRTPTDETMAAVEGWLEGRTRDEGDTRDALLPGFAPDLELEREWLAAYREIRASDAAPAQKTLDVDALASLVAHIAWARAERAGERRAAAIQAMSEAGKARAESNARVPLRQVVPVERSPDRRAVPKVKRAGGGG